MLSSRLEIQERKQTATWWDSRLQLQNADAGRQTEAPVTGAAWIHYRDDHIDGGEHRFMGMSVDDDLRVRKSVIQLLRRGRAELIAVSKNNIEAVQLDRGNLRQSRSKLHSVGVAVHSRHRSQRFQFGQQVWGTNITRVQDVIDLGKRLKDLGPEQTVGIRNDTKTHQCTNVIVADPVPTFDWSALKADSSSAGWNVQCPNRSISVSLKKLELPAAWTLA